MTHLECGVVSVELVYYYICFPLAVILVFSIHEYSRAVASTLLGDVTPKLKKRLSFNPLKNVEPIGLIFALITGFGWGNPVPTSALHYKNKKLGTVIAYVIPMMVNAVFAVGFNLIFKLMDNYANLPAPGMLRNLYLATMVFVGYLAMFNMSYALFNLVPVYPLAGSKILTALISPEATVKKAHFEAILQLVLIVLMLAGLFHSVIFPICDVILDGTMTNMPFSIR